MVLSKEPTKPREDLLRQDARLKEQLLRRQVSSTMIVGLVGLALSLVRVFEFGFKPITAVQLLLFVILLLVFLTRRRHRLGVLGQVVSILVLVWILTAVANYGILAPAVLLAPFLPIFSAIIFGRQKALWLFGMFSLGFGIIGVLYLSGTLVYQVDVVRFVHSWTSWLTWLVVPALATFWYLLLIDPINAAERTAAERLEGVLQGINDALLIHDKDTGAILQVNQKMCEMWGYSAEEVLSLDVGIISAGEPPYARKDAQTWMQKAALEGPQLFTWQAKHRDGTLFWVEVNMRIARLGGTERLLVLVRDISARKQAEETLARQQAFDVLTAKVFSRLADDSSSSMDDVVSDGLGEMARLVGAELSYIVLANSEGTAYSVVYEWCAPGVPSLKPQLTNLPRGTSPWAEEQILTGQIVSLSRLSDAPPEAEPTSRRWQARGVRSILQVPFRGRSQSLVLGGLNLVSLTHEIDWQKPDIQRVVLLADSLANAIERKWAAELLRESEERYKALFERSLDLVYVSDLEGRFVDANDAALKRLGYERSDIPTLNVSTFLSEDQLPLAFRRMQEIQQTGVQSGLAEYRLRHRDGSLVYVETNGAALYSNGQCVAILSVARDITGRRLLEEQLRQAQKMEAIGSLAGGVAHDFNNLLSVILNCAEFALESLGPDHPARGDLSEVKKTTMRAATLTRQLLAFSRKQVLQPVPLNLNDVATGLEEMLRRVIGENIDFVQRLEPKLGVVLADPGQIEQVIMNLVVNARDALPGGGKLTIETANVELDEQLAMPRADVAPGRYVRLSVTDNGCGMDAQTKARIFDPFFTTKDKGRGTGLGLATVYGIVKQSGGNIWVYSEPGQGTTFKIYLPRTESAPVATASMHLPVPKRIIEAATILLVEDEEALRKVSQRTLESAGFTVLTAADGYEALTLSTQYTGEIHLLVTDVILPRMGGKPLAERLASSRPAMKVLYVSGYTDNAIVHQGVLDPGIQFLGKPFAAIQLTQKVLEVLDGDGVGINRGLVDFTATS